MRLSILLIAFSTVLTGLLPTYQQVGLLSPALFTGLRILQGLSVGGEYSGVMIYLAESAPINQRGFLTSFAATGANVGFLLASLTILIIDSTLSATALQTWGWRLPFLSMSLLAAIVLYYRLKIPETPVYFYIQDHKKITHKPLLDAIKLVPKQLIKILALTCMSSTFYYVFFGYMPTYLEHYVGIPSTTGLKIQSVFLVVMLFIVPIAGFWGDQLGRKRMLVITAISIILMVYPCFYLLSAKTLLLVVICLGLATLISSLDQGNSLTTVVENCPADVRYSGVAFSYNLGMAIFGGTAPFIVSLLTDKFGALAPAYYLMLMASISLVAVLFMITNQKDILFTTQ